ncbi:histidine kinase N-terminal domain-containing protein [Mesobacillus sp. AQ2]|jgi:signal transduction histidine kinase|uniref:histidine kinase N-terminal domain-containing protein n=1 Tax=unclassified Mesobacillus TaxID=2675270 RepID=UPI00204138FE|nr:MULTISPECIES: histidine kinase N-terminal domain-containing protein [unclassified Mesobacillus]MCM3125357.1 ATP-binding protein [Mesobacillus sp. MER 33]MCM3235496.1 ATP-binding protein [Mesobacillus sp. MER 48]WHX41763.1 histidine kinase N-terminal domain-containing protein [Mesobacillus sp. AQ2]
MLPITDNRLLSFLTSEREQLIADWAVKIIVSEDDPYKEKITKNAEKMYEIILSVFSKTNEELEDHLQKLAFMVGEERVRADINIGDFVYNVNSGRSVLYKHLHKMNMEWEDMQESINRINYCFDTFLYYAVSYYNEQKNKIIEEKNQFIDSTHKDRLTLLGQMTSSFIHEFRNPLTSIQGFIQLLRSEHEDMKYLDIISGELEQLNFRISQFLLLSKKELIGKEKKLFSLNRMIDEVLNFLYPSILDTNVRIAKEVADDMELYGYSDEIRQVLINIIFNAIDVLSQYRADPKIEIKGYFVNDTHIKIEISNNGPVIPDQLLKTIFEPFVTTKTLGTGLGLFVCREIIEKHKGILACSSEPDKTSFIMLLPLIRMEN